jgi:hypothetical protein
MEEFVLTVHAAQMAQERGIKYEWICMVLRDPSATHPDVGDVKLTHVLRRISDYGNRMLRLVIDSTQNPPRVITLFFDRKASREMP